MITYLLCGVFFAILMDLCTKDFDISLPELEKETSPFVAGFFTHSVTILAWPAFVLLIIILILK